MSKDTYKHFSYDNHARLCEFDDLQGQILRTSKGKPISEEQIQLIVNTIKRALTLSDDDIILDLACGNGSISHYLFDSCQGYLGVDVSNYLIEVAQKFFQKKLEYSFKSDSAIDYLRNETHPERFTKLLCFAAFQYFTDKEALILLTLINERFYNISNIFLGNLPDRDKHDLFYQNESPSITELDDHKTAIGRWRTKKEVLFIVKSSGWDCSFTSMPNDFYASGYRYDVNIYR